MYYGFDVGGTKIEFGAFNEQLERVATERIPTQTEDYALLVDDICVENFIKQVKLLEDSEFRQSKINEGFKQAKKFSWDLCFEETIAFYNEIFKSKFNT